MTQAVALQHREEIIQGLSKGQRLTDIVQALQIPTDRFAISKALRSDPQYREAIEAGFEARLDTSEAELENIDPSNVARARARFQAVAWRAERECRERWGAQPVAGNGNFSIQVVNYNVVIAPQAVEHVTPSVIDHNASSRTVTESVTVDVAPSQQRRAEHLDALARLTPPK